MKSVPFFAWCQKHVLMKSILLIFCLQISKWGQLVLYLLCLKRYSKYNRTKGRESAIRNGRKIGGKMAGNVEDKIAGNNGEKIWRENGGKWMKTGRKCG
jgi:hypothetical protein